MTRRTVAAIQFCATASWQQNQLVLDELLAQAQGASLILLPENFACYGGDYRQLAARSNEIITWLAHHAQQLNAWIIAGSLPLLTRPDGSPVPVPLVRTSQLVVSPQGKVTARYDKMHLFDVQVDDAQGRYQESAIFEAGTLPIVTQLGDLTCGLAICFDLRFASLAMWLAQQGARLLVYPSAFTQKTGEAHWEILLKARAIETGCYVLAANQCGQHSSKRTSYGHSMLVDPWGCAVAMLDNQPGVLVADLDLDFQQRIQQQLPVLTQQKFEVSFYGLNSKK